MVPAILNGHKYLVSTTTTWCIFRNYLAYITQILVYITQLPGGHTLNTW
jgi:hypothetical protein